MKTPLTPLLAILATASPALATTVQTYDLQVFDPSSVNGIEFGFYSALSNNGPLVSAFDDTFDPVGVLTWSSGASVFRVGLVQEEYCWYRGVNNHFTTVGFRDESGSPDTKAWLRGRNGLVRTFGEPGERTFLYRVNDSNVAVGETTTGGGVAWSAYLVDELGGRTVSVPGVDPSFNTYFAAINNRGKILGATWNDVEHHPFILHDGTVTYFDVPGAHEVGLRALNNRAQAAGFWTEFDALVGDYVSHGFIREWDGEIRTVDLDYGFPQHEDIDPDLYGGYPIVEAHSDLLAQGTAILDLNDRGQILAEMTGWYLITLVMDGMGEVQFTEPRWTYPIATPAP